MMCRFLFQICHFFWWFFNYLWTIIIMGTHLPQPVFFPHKDTSKEVRMMQQREQVGAEQNWVCPLSPILHIRRVPCHRRFSFPADRPVLTNCPRVSTAALERVELFFRIFLVVHGSREWVAFVTYRRRIQLRMLQVPRSCTRAGPVGMSFLRVSTRLWTVRPLYVKKSTSSGNPDPFFFVFDDAK